MKHIITAFACMGLTACASVTTGTTQSMLIDSQPAGAACTLANDKGTWMVKETPENVMVSRSYSAMSVACEKGKLKGVSTVQSGTKGMAFGNIIAGGIIGAAVDMSSGAAYDYPAQVTVELSK